MKIKTVQYDLKQSVNRNIILQLLFYGIHIILVRYISKDHEKDILRQLLHYEMYYNKRRYKNLSQPVHLQYFTSYKEFIMQAQKKML